MSVYPGVTSDGRPTDVIDLAQPLHPGIPSSPSHPGFKHALLRRHGDAVRVDGTSGASDLLVLGTHTGTHIDALAHISHDGLLHGGTSAAVAQSTGAFTSHGIDELGPVVAPGVVLDVPAVRGEERLPPGDAVTADDLQRAAALLSGEIPRGAVLMVRTGWAQLWDSPTRFLSHDGGVPGPDVGAAEWLLGRAPRLVGSDTTAFEHIPPGQGHARLPVHKLVLVDHGVPIIEMLDLELVCQLGAHRHTFVAAPLPIRGATGSPVRPVAIV